MESWSPSLKLALDMVLSSGFPMALRWGPEGILIYNDGYRPILGEKHPWALGRPAREAWSEIWPQIEPVHLEIMAGERGAVFAEDSPLRIQRRKDRWEDAHFTLSYSPAPDPTAPRGIGGILVTLVETTQRVETERQLRKAEEALRHLNETLEHEVEARTGELARAQDALRQSQKMDAIGQLTGGIAHDFNNMLAIVIGSLDLASRRLARGDAAIERYLENAREGAVRAATLTQRLLAFSRQSPLSPKVLNLNTLVASMSELLRRTLGEPIALEAVLDDGLWPAHVDPNQMESVIVNLAVNARDAMPDGGRLTIETGNVHLDERYAAREVGLEPGQYVMIAVTDVGAGMSPDVLQKVFDPFFTTKPVGRGTGLGLSMVYGFARQSGGHVRIDSEPGQGTAVKVYLPRHFGSAEEADAAARVDGPAPASHAETVLVVEDEDGVRQMSCDALRELGYTVHSATSGEEALRAFDGLGHVDVLFTDVVMGGMSGRQLADILRRKAPVLKVLFTTGYTRNAVVHNGILDPGVAFLPKPFTVKDLATKLRAVLDA